MHWQGSLTEGEGSVQLTSFILDQLPFTLKILLIFFTTQARLMRRSIVLSLPPQLVFPGIGVILIPRLLVDNCLADRHFVDKDGVNQMMPKSMFKNRLYNYSLCTLVLLTSSALPGGPPPPPPPPPGGKKGPPGEPPQRQIFFFKL